MPVSVSGQVTWSTLIAGTGIGVDVGTAVDWAMPLPLTGADCGLSDALSVTVSRPTRLPLADGEKVTTIWHVPPAERREPQLDFQSPTAKSPVTSALEIVSAAAPVFVTVTNEQVSVAPTRTSGHDGGSICTIGAGVGEGVADGTAVVGVPPGVPVVVPDVPGVPVVLPGVPAPADETTETVPAPAVEPPGVPAAPVPAPAVPPAPAPAPAPGVPPAPAAPVPVVPPVMGIVPAAPG